MTGTTDMHLPTALVRRVEMRPHARHRARWTGLPAPAAVEMPRITGGPALPEGACGCWTRLHMGIGGSIADPQDCLRPESAVLPALSKAGPCGEAAS